MAPPPEDGRRVADREVLDGLTGATHDAARVRSRLRALTPPRSGRPATPDSPPASGRSPNSPPPA